MVHWSSKQLLGGLPSKKTRISQQGTCEDDFPFLFPFWFGICFLVPWRLVFFPPHLFVNVSAGSSDSMDSVRDTRIAPGVACEIGWVLKWTQGGGCVFEKGVKVIQTWLYIYILYIYIYYIYIYIYTLGVSPTRSQWNNTLFIFMKGPL